MIDSGTLKKIDKIVVNHQKNNFDDLSDYFGNCLIDSENHRFACFKTHCNNNCMMFQNKSGAHKLNFQVLQFFPDDHLNWCNNIFPDLLSFLKTLTHEVINDCRFSFNHRYVFNDGAVTQFLHEGKFLYERNMKYPVLKIRTFTEIGDIKTDDSIVLSVFKYFNGEGFKRVFSKSYSNFTNNVLSNREIEIIKLCYNGFTSKQIAEQLCLSIHTIKNHKRNSMKKTNTHNINQLVNYCIVNKCI